MKNLFKILTFLCLTTTLILLVISCHSQRPKFGNNEDPSCQEIIAEKYYQEKYLQLEKDIQEMSQIVYFNDKNLFDPWNGSIIIDLPYNPDTIINYVYNKYTYVPLYFKNPADAYFDNANLRLTY